MLKIRISSWTNKFHSEKEVEKQLKDPQSFQNKKFSDTIGDGGGESREEDSEGLGVWLEFSEKLGNMV